MTKNLGTDHAGGEKRRSRYRPAVRDLPYGVMEAIAALSADRDGTFAIGFRADQRFCDNALPAAGM
jgi:hypothetical protein